MRGEFSTAGYYALDIPAHPGVRLVVLNSVLFSKKSEGARSANAAVQQLDWLRQQLQAAKDHHQQVLIALHIPPELDVYLMQRIRLFSFRQFWQQPYLDRFREELAEFYPEVAGILAGHVHYDWMQSLNIDNHPAVPVMGVQSISPVFGNEPGFKVFYFDEANDRFIDYYAYSYSLRSQDAWSVAHVFQGVGQASGSSQE
jgi:hypothetical protein